MTCPFSGPCDLTSNNEDENRSRDGQSGRGRKESFGKRSWNMGPSVDALSNSGVVQQRVSSFLSLSKTSSSPTSSAARGANGDARSNVKSGKGYAGKKSQRKGSSNQQDKPLFRYTRVLPDPKQPLTLQSLTEAVWNFITIPTDHLLHALDALLKSGGSEWKNTRRKLSIVGDSVAQWDDWHLDDLLTTLVKQLETDLESFMTSLGKEYVKECRKYYEKALMSLSFNLEGFLTNLIGICDILKTAQNQHLKTTNDVPKLLINRDAVSGLLILHFFTNREPIQFFINGLITGISEQVFKQNVKINCEKCVAGSQVIVAGFSQHRFYFRYFIEEIPSLNHFESGASRTQNSDSNICTKYQHRKDGSQSDISESNSLENLLSRESSREKICDEDSQNLSEDDTLAPVNVDDRNLQENGLCEDDCLETRQTDISGNKNLKAQLLNNNFNAVVSLSDENLYHIKSEEKLVTPVIRAMESELKPVITNENKNNCDFLSDSVPTLRKDNRKHSKGFCVGDLIGCEQYLSDRCSDSKISVRGFCLAFPWHFICNRDMRCIQMGSGLYQVFGAELVSENQDVSSRFTVLSPEGVPLQYNSIATTLNTPFVLAFKCHPGSRVKVQDMQLKGQMIECLESNSLLFVGSPLLDGMDGLTSHGLYLSDIPIHDATRDVILVGEQARAQHGVKRRMAQLKDSILKANQAVDEERERNVSLLHTIFPPDIAKRLWLGEVIEAQKHEAVSMLFSDIVGFTSICSTASPLTVIDMLQNLYTKFDALCGYLDIYKVETIGDAYCVAGNLHRSSRHHAQRVTWMALRMMETCSAHRTHLGEAIKMRIGIHTGPVLAGVVGTTMPRYCLFGSNVTLANNIESTSEPLKVNISPTTHRHLITTETFTFTQRLQECLPKAFPQDVDSFPYFVDSYTHPDLPADAPVADHVDRALRDILRATNLSQNVI